MSNPIDPLTLGLLCLFGGVGVGLLLGGLLGWMTRFEWGMACGLLCVAAGGLGGAAHVAWYAQFGSGVIEQAALSRCEERQLYESSSSRSWVRIDHVEHRLADGRVLRLRLPFVTGRCAVDRKPTPMRLRYALKDAASAGAEPIMAELERDPRQPWMVVGALSAFGGFGLLAGLFFVGGALAERARVHVKPGKPTAQAPLAPWRERMSSGLVVAGNIGLFAGAGFAIFGNLSTERSIIFMFGAAALSCCEYLAAAALARRLDFQSAMILVIVGSGMGVAAWAVHALM